MTQQMPDNPRDLEQIIEAYSRVTERLEQSHRSLTREVERLHGQLAEKNRELARQERLAALGEMAAGVAHEVRNPLGAIRLYASMLNRDLAELPDCQRLVRNIASAVETLDGIVGDILTFAGGEPIDSAPVSVAVLWDDVLSLVAPQRDALQATIHVDERTRGTTVLGDVTQLTRSLLNLVYNALDAAGERGNVWVRTDIDTEGLAHIAIADDGPGVDDDLRQRIFNPFFTTKGTGTGLGLSIVHRIAEAHGGRIEVSQRSGGGAVFTLVVPVAAEPEAPATRSHPARQDQEQDRQRQEVG